MMRRRHAAGRATPPNPVEQEIVRANRALAAYFKGQRTEREALGALKIIKAFIKERERMDPSKRPPLPGPAGRKVAARGGGAQPVRPKVRALRHSPLREVASTESKGSESGDTNE
jgi:hypothetical protein